MKNNPSITQYKIVLLGDTNVGKTTIFTRYIHDKVDKNVGSTIGVDFEVKSFTYKKKKYKIKLFDTAGQERFRTITQAYFHMGDAFLIVFDLTNENSLISIHEWIQSVQDAVDNCTFIILGNKSDLVEKLISEDIINEHVKKYKNFFFKTSAIKNKNIKEAISKLIDLLDEKNIKNRNNSFAVEEGNNYNKFGNQENNNKCC